MNGENVVKAWVCGFLSSLKTRSCSYYGRKNEAQVVVCLASPNNNKKEKKQSNYFLFDTACKQCLHWCEYKNLKNTTVCFNNRKSIGTRLSKTLILECSCAHLSCVTSYSTSEKTIWSTRCTGTFLAHHTRFPDDVSKAFFAVRLCNVCHNFRSGTKLDRVGWSNPRKMSFAV